MNITDYNHLLQILLHKCAQLKVEVDFDHRQSVAADGNTVCGAYFPTTKSIHIIVYKNQDHLSIVATLAHEVRHAEQDYLGLYSEIYSLVKKSTNDLLDHVSLVGPPSYEVSLEMENDCNLFAVNFLKAHGFHLSLTDPKHAVFLNPYPKEWTLTHRINTYMQNERVS